MTDTPAQFGVLGVQEKRDWPALTREEVASVLDPYGLPPMMGEVAWHGQRPFSATGIVPLEDGRNVFLKRHDIRLRDAAALAEEHGFADHLATKNLPVSLASFTLAGQRSVQRNGWIYEVYPELEGGDLYRDVQSWGAFLHNDDAYNAGKRLAQLHLAAADYDAPARQHRPLVSSCTSIIRPDFEASLEAWVAAEPGLASALEGREWKEQVAQQTRPYRNALEPYLADLKPCWGHGDWHGSNLAWKDGTISGIFDFGMSDRTFAAFDLAVAIERSAVAWLNLDDPDPVRYERLAAMLFGYESYNLLAPSDHAMMIGFLPLVHVEFALSEVAYYGTLLGDKAAADVAYDDYLLGHLRWFGSDPGRDLLDWLVNELP